MIRVSGTNKITSETSLNCNPGWAKSIVKASRLRGKWRWFSAMNEEKEEVSGRRKAMMELPWFRENEISVGANLCDLAAPPSLARKATDSPRLSLSANPRSPLDSSNLFVSSSETISKFLPSVPLRLPLCRCQPITTILRQRIKK